MWVKIKAKVGTLTYGIVTITNTGASSEVLWTATATNPPFWPTWGGTCNSLLLRNIARIATTRHRLTKPL